MKSGNIFWGLLLIVLGGLIFLRNFDIFFFSWGSILRLWPLLFIFWGISVLPVKSGIKILLSVITIGIGFAILATNPTPRTWWGKWERNDVWIDKDEEEYDNESAWKEQQFSEAMDETIKYAVLDMDAAAGEFILSGQTSKLFEFRTEGKNATYEAKTRKTEEQKVVVDFENKKIRGRDGFHNTVYMQLNNLPVWTLNMDVGAADLEMDLTPYKIQKIDIDGGAFSIDMKLGDTYKNTKVNIDAGAAGITIRVPENSACEIQTSTILSGKDFEGFQKIKKGLYQTPNFSESANQIIIQVDAAVSGINVKRY